MDDQISRGVPHGAVPAPSDSEPNPGETAATFAATLADEWANAGVAHAVLAPGSRSTPITLALDAEPRIATHVVHDERSAGFMALGIGRATGVPAVVACTSGTAATHFHASVVEADLAAVPMIVVTADRPPELQGVLAPQTIDQRELYGRSVRWYCEPGPPAPGSSPWWRDLARDTLERCTGTLPGPVHLNLAFRDPLTAEPAELPPEPPAHSGSGAPADAPAGVMRGVPWGPTDEEVARLSGAVSGRRGLILAGERSAFDDAEAESIWRLADILGWPVIADPQSGLRLPREGVVSTADAILRHPGFARAHRPEVVLHLGGLLASRVVNQFCGDSGALHVAADRFGRNPDPDRIMVSSLVVAPAVLAESLLAGSLLAASPSAAAADWRSAWVAAERTARGAIESTVRNGDATEPAVAMDVASAAAGGTHLVVSSSMPVRDLENFAAPRNGLTVHANRGANGIDGVTSTAIGVAIATGSPTILLTGDVAFLHDMGALVALARRELDLTIVVVDNDGGGIFGFLPQAGLLGEERFERLFGTPHGTDIATLVGSFGLPVETVGTRAGFRAALAGALARRGIRVVLVSTAREANVAEHERLWSAVGEAVAEGP